jgi:hypothetical protein
MAICLLLVVCSFFFFVSCSLWEHTSAASNDFVKEPTITCINEQIKVNVDYGEVKIPGLVTFDARLYSVNGHTYYPGPTIQMKPGERG